jgi:hypothetical protein
MAMSAFRDIAALIGDYLRIGVSEHTARKHARSRARHLRQVMTEARSRAASDDITGAPALDSVLRDLALDEISYDPSGKAFLIPQYGGGKARRVYRFSLSGDAAAADMVVPLAGGNSVFVTVEGGLGLRDAAPAAQTLSAGQGRIVESPQAPSPELSSAATPADARNRKAHAALGIARKLATALVFLMPFVKAFAANLHIPLNVPPSLEKTSDDTKYAHHKLYETSEPYVRLFEDSALTNEFPGFTRSYQGAVASTNVTDIGDHGASSYDLTNLGRIELYNGKTNIIDTFVTKWEKGSTINNEVFYFGNSYTNPAGQTIKGLPFNIVRILGRDAGHGQWWNTWDWGIDTGASAYLIELALDAYRQTGRSRYLSFAVGQADALLKLQDSDGGFRFAPIGVYHVLGPDVYWKLKSTEKNERILNALDNLYSVTNAPRFAQAATNAMTWLASMYDTTNHLYRTASYYDATGGKWVAYTVDEYFATDATALAPIGRMLADSRFGASQAARDAELSAMFAATESRTAYLDSIGNPKFFKFSCSQAGLYGSSEFSAQMAVAYLKAAQIYTERGDTERRDFYIYRYWNLTTSLRDTFFKSASSNALARVAPYASYLDGSMAGGVYTGTGYNTESYEAALASVWIGFALSGFDPARTNGGPGIPLTPPAITNIASDATNSDVVVTIKDPPGAARYDIYYKDSMTNGLWKAAETNYPVSGTGTTRWTDKGGADRAHPAQAPKRFYKVSISADSSPDGFSMNGLPGFIAPRNVPWSVLIGWALATAVVKARGKGRRIARSGGTFILRPARRPGAARKPDEQSAMEPADKSNDTKWMLPEFGDDAYSRNLKELEKGGLSLRDDEISIRREKIERELFDRIMLFNFMHSGMVVPDLVAVTDSWIDPEAERVHAIELADAVKIAGNAVQKRPVILALGTSWIKGYRRGEPVYSDMNKLISAIDNFCAEKGIAFVRGEDGELESKIEAEKSGKHLTGAKVIVLASKESILPDGAVLAHLRNDENTFLAAVDADALDQGCYIRLCEMLRMALELGLKDLFKERVDIDNANIKADPVAAFRNVYLFLPRAERIPVYETLRALYRVQEFA